MSKINPLQLNEVQRLFMLNACRLSEGVLEWDLADSDFKKQYDVSKDEMSSQLKDLKQKLHAIVERPSDSKLTDCTTMTPKNFLQIIVCNPKYRAIIPIAESWEEVESAINSVALCTREQLDYVKSVGWGKN